MHSNYIGVNFDKRAGKWCSAIKHKGITHDCGYYIKEKEAAKARDLRIIKLGLPLDKLQILKPKK